MFYPLPVGGEGFRSVKIVIIMVNYSIGLVSKNQDRGNANNENPQEKKPKLDLFNS